MGYLGKYYNINTVENLYFHFPPKSPDFLINHKMLRESFYKRKKAELQIWHPVFLRRIFPGTLSILLTSFQISKLE